MNVALDYHLRAMLREIVSLFLIIIAIITIAFRKFFHHPSMERLIKQPLRLKARQEKM
jgi:hypothetical protein